MSAARLLGVAVVAFALSLASAPRAEGPADGGALHTVAAAGKAAVHVRTINRAVRVVGWGRPEVKVVGGGAISLDASEDHTRVGVTASPEGSEPIDVFVPAGSRVEVRTLRGEVTVSEVTGPVRVATVDAKVKIKGAPKEVETETVSGGIELDLAVCDVRASSVGGSIQATCRDKASKVHAKTVSAPLTVKGVSFVRLEIRSVSGSVDADGKVAGDGPFELRSHSGNVTLTVPKGTPIVVDARSRARVEIKPSPDAGAASSGAPTVILRTFNGDVKVLER